MGPPPVHARVRVVNKAGVSDHSELESESEYSQISDYYQEKVRLATAEQTNFTLGLQDSGLLRQQEEDEEMKREEKVRQERVKLEEKIKMSRSNQQQQQLDEDVRMARMNQQTRLHQDHQERHHHHEQHHHEQHLHQEHHQQKHLHQEHHQQHIQQDHRPRHHRTEVEHHQNVVASDLITPVILQRATATMRVSPPKNNFDVLIRVLEEPDYLGGGTEIEDDVSSVHSVLTEEERFRLREVIMTDERIQTILKETHTTEKMLQLKDYRQIEQVIHPQKWDVLIRIIDNADQTAGRKTTGSSVTAQELRSMTEVMVDYGYNDNRSGYSGRSSDYTQAVGPTADRSGTEIMETDHYIEAAAATVAA